MLFSNLIVGQSLVEETFQPTDSLSLKTFSKGIVEQNTNFIVLIPTFGFDDRSNYKIFVNKQLLFEGVLHSDAIKGRTGETINIKKRKKLVLKICNEKGELICKKELNKNYRTILLQKFSNKWRLTYTNNNIGWD